MNADKAKVGTVLDTEAYRRLKLVATQTDRTVSDLLRDAINHYFRESPDDLDRRRNTLRLLESSHSGPNVEDKVKVPAQLSRFSLQRAKMLAAQENTSLSEVIEKALRMYSATHLDKSTAEPGLERFLNSPLRRLSWKEFKEIMELDYYDQ